MIYVISVQWLAWLFLWLLLSFGLKREAGIVMHAYIEMARFNYVLFSRAFLAHYSLLCCLTIYIYIGAYQVRENCFIMKRLNNNP